MAKPLTITIELADGDALLAAIVSRAAELLVARLAPEATRRTEEAVDKLVASLLDSRIAAAVDAALAKAARLEAQFAALKAAQQARAAEKRGPQRSDDWLAEQAVDSVLRGAVIAYIWP